MRPIEASNSGFTEYVKNEIVKVFKNEINRLESTFGIY